MRARLARGKELGHERPRVIGGVQTISDELQLGASKDDDGVLVTLQAGRNARRRHPERLYESCGTTCVMANAQDRGDGASGGRQRRGRAGRPDEHIQAGRVKCNTPGSKQPKREDLPLARRRRHGRVSLRICRGLSPQRSIGPQQSLEHSAALQLTSAHAIYFSRPGAAPCRLATRHAAAAV